MSEYLDAEELRLILTDLVQGDLSVREGATTRLERLLNVAAEEGRPPQDETELDSWWRVKVALLNRPEIVNALLAALEDSSPRMRAFASIHPGNIEDARAEQALVDHMQHDGHPQVRMMCMSALRGRMSSRLFDTVVEALGDRDAQVIRTACIALGETGDARAVGPLRGMLVHPDWDVRHRACQALVRLGAVDARVVTELEALSVQPDAAEWDDIVQRDIQFNRSLGRTPEKRLLTVAELTAQARIRLEGGAGPGLEGTA